MHAVGETEQVAANEENERHDDMLSGMHRVRIILGDGFATSRGFATVGCEL
jgi:hypothetical protein